MDRCPHPNKTTEEMCKLQVGGMSGDAASCQERNQGSTKSLLAHGSNQKQTKKQIISRFDMILHAGHVAQAEVF